MSGTFEAPPVEAEAETGEEIILNVELKGQGTGRVVAEYLATIDNPVLVSSFNHEELARFRSVDGLTPVAPLFDKWQTQWLEIAEALALDEVRLIPCHQPPHRGEPGASRAERLAMLRLAVDEQPILMAPCASAPASWKA